jgi:uncharacterized membrane protein SirB2
MLAEHYPLLKAVHVTAVVVSVSLLLVRSLIGLREGPAAVPKLLRIVPHIVDTLLLASAVCLSILLRQYPFVDGWLTAKFLALCAYIVVGTFAIRRGRTATIRAVCLAGALLIFGYIVGTALHHDPAVWRW